MARDWLKSLFKASFRGADFWVEADVESGGRRVGRGFPTDFPVVGYSIMDAKR